MDNRGYAVDWYGPPAQPVYELRSSRPEYVRQSRKRRDRDSSSDTSMTDYRKYSVEYPPDDGVMRWIVVLACAVLHICSELVYYMFFNTIEIARLRNPRLVTPKDTYMEFMVFEDVRFSGEIIAAFASVFLGYRVVAAFGSLCVLGGFLGASFVEPSDKIELMGFLVGFLGGLGVSFWRFAAFVAVMEYFRRQRMTAIILSGFGRVIGIIVGYSILVKPFMDLRDPATSQADIDNMTEWPTYFQCQCAMAAVGFLASLFISPLSLVKTMRGHECAYFLRVRESRVCRGGMLMLVLAVYFIYYLGESLPITEMIVYLDITKQFSSHHIVGTMFAIAMGVFLGYLLLPFWPLKKKLYSTLQWMGGFCLFMGLITLQLPAFSQVTYVCTYSILFAASQVLFESVLRYVIPIAFGRQYIRWVEGLLGLMAGCATIANNYIARELRMEGPEYQSNVFYFAGSAFLGAGFLAIIAIQLVKWMRFRDRNHERYDREYEEEVKEVPRSRSRHSRRELRSSRRDPSPRVYHGYQYR